MKKIVENSFVFDYAILCLVVVMIVKRFFQATVKLFRLQFENQNF